MSKLHPQMNFEGRIIDAILNCIKDNQSYLTQPENLPQLAKLGYMYNTLWYAGRHASYEGKIPKEVIVEEDGETFEMEQCGDNPKYKIEMCEPENDDIENYIYDAWGMHVSNDFGPDWAEFSQIVLNGRPLSEIEIKMLKPQKTFDEWVEILTDPEYQYSSIYPDRRAVANHMLCTIGNGYGYKDGFVINEASGADQDSTDYGDWMNAKFREDIQELVNEIMADPEVELVIRVTEVSAKKHREEEEARDIKAFGMPYKDFLKSEKFKKLQEHFPDELPEYRTYYPLCSYSKISMFDKDTHPSYIAAAVEICNDILAHREEEDKKNKGNVLFAERFLKKMNNNFVAVHEEKSITEEELKVKIQQVKSSFTVEGAPLIKSDRFIQEEYDAMAAKTDSHKSHFDHIKAGKKVWTDEEIGEQIKTVILQNQVSEHELNKFVKEYLATNEQGKDLKKEKKAFKKALYDFVGWDKLTPLDPNFWRSFGSAPYSMSHNHRNIGEVERGYGAVGMEDIFATSFSDTYHLRYGINNILHNFEQGWKEKENA